MVYYLNDHNVRFPVSARYRVEQAPVIRKVLNVEILERVPRFELTRNRGFTNNFSMQTICEEQGSERSRSPSNRLCPRVSLFL